MKNYQICINCIEYAHGICYDSDVWSNLFGLTAPPIFIPRYIDVDPGFSCKRFILDEEAELEF